MKKTCLIMNWLMTFSFIALFLASCSTNETIVWVASPWQRVLSETPPDSAAPQQVSVSAAANEYEPFRIIIHNSSENALSDLNVTVSSMKNESAEISGDNVHLYRAYYLNVDTPSYRTKSPVGHYPDALLPFRNNAQGSDPAFIAAPFSVDTARNAEIWCDLYVPAGTAAGTYEGEVKITMKGKEIAEVPVSLTVWNFELPDKISMASHFGSLNKSAIAMMGIKDSVGIVELTELYNKELLKHRAVPSTPDYVWPAWNEKEGIIENGASERMKKLIEQDHVNAIDIPFLYIEEPKKCQAYLKDIAEWLRGLGYLKLAYIYMEDEPNTPEQYEIVRKQGAMIKAADPEIGRMCTEQTITSNPAWGNLYGAVSMWCPLWGLWNDSTARERLDAGEALWSYTALCQGAEGTPWWQIDTEPLSYRAPFWTSWHYDITGYLYWNSTWWNTYKTMAGVYEAPSFRGRFWGEGSVLYPGEPAGVKGFVPSIRLKLYREAMEDYEYMTLAAGMGKGADVDRIVERISSSFQKWSHDPADYQKAREELAGLILSGK